MRGYLLVWVAYFFFSLMARLAAPVILLPVDYATLRSIIKKGTHKSRKITRARVLLAMGSGKARLVVQTESGI